jgi:hypothetical protein
MPPLPKRRNTAYLNRWMWQFGREDRDLDGEAPQTFPDLRLISGARSNNFSDPTNFPVCACELDEVRAPRERREKCHPVFVLPICAF